MKKKLKSIDKPAKLGFCSFLGDTQGCGTIRVIYPYLLLNHYRKRDLMINATYLMNYVLEPDWYQNYTFVQFQRAATEAHLNLIKRFKNTVQKRYPIPLVYEIDDMLFDIPKWNYASIYYNQNEDVIKRIMKEANAMVVSTLKLKEIYSEYCKNITVIPNHLPKFIWGDVYPKHDYKNEREKIKILWAGSQNHFSMKDVVGEENKGGDFGNELLNFIRKTTDKYDWYFCGAIPEELNDVKNKLNFRPWENIFNYPKMLKDIEPDIMLAPLQDLKFNHCKSNIKSLEIAATGAVGIYSDVTPYKFMTTKARTDEEFVDHIEKLASDIDLRSKVYNKDYRRVESNLFWEENGNLRKYINTYLSMFGQCL